MITMTPVHELRHLPEAGEHCYESDGIDPQFQIPVPALTGDTWVRFTLRGTSEGIRNLKIYFDAGEGYNERHAAALGWIHTDEREIVQYVYLPGCTASIRLDPGESPGCFTLQLESLNPVSHGEVTGMVVRRLLARCEASPELLVEYGKRLDKGGEKGWTDLLNMELYGSAVNRSASNGTYRFMSHPQITALYQPRAAEIGTWKENPVISLLVPVYNPPLRYLQACVESVRAQVYPYWELCLADDCSTDVGVRTYLQGLTKDDPRIKVVFRPKNGHICHATNSALDIATGAYIGLLDNDDVLPPHALFEMASAIAADPSLDYLYSDEDKIDDDGQRFEPFFKPDWSPDMLMGIMYTCHLSVYRRSLVEEVGRFRPGYEGSQDHDLCLRATERTTHIKHIDKILYHWRVHSLSTSAVEGVKTYTSNATERAIKDAVQRRGRPAVVLPSTNPGSYTVDYIPVGNPLVSIFIPTRDGASILRLCLETMRDLTTYRNYEVIVIDNGSVQPETFELFKEAASWFPNRFTVIRHDAPFNYPKLNNLAAERAKGDLFLLLNNDIEIITPGWLSSLVGYAQLPHIGCVGAKLLYPDRTIQHAGVIHGLGGVAGHSHKYFPEDSLGYFRRLVVPSNYSAVTAACLMIRADLYRKVSGLDESFAVAFNDVDFCLRVRDLGTLAVVPPQVVLIHHESKSRGGEDTPEKVERFNSECNRMKSRWGAALLHDPMYNRNLTMFCENFALTDIKYHGI